MKPNVKILHDAFTVSAQRQSYYLDVTAIVYTKDKEDRLRVHIKRNAYDAQGNFEVEVWHGESWREVVRHDPEEPQCKALPSPYIRDYRDRCIEAETQTRIIAQQMLDEALSITGWSLYSHETAEAIAYRLPSELCSARMA